MAFADKSQIFQKSPAVSQELLAQGIEQYLIQREEMVCQIFKTPTGISIQARKLEEWKKYLLLDNAIQINLTQTDAFVTVHVGAAKWIDKGIAMGVGMIAAWPVGLPLMALSAIGGVGLVAMPDKILGFVDQFLKTGGKSIVIPAGEVPEGKVCPFCHKTVPVSSKYCSECGEPFETQSKIKTCSSCGYAYEDNLSYCPACGKKLK